MSKGFLEVNVNPKGRKTGDCVVRAIAYATNTSWEDVLLGLTELAVKLKYMPNSRVVLKKYLNNKGYYMSSTYKTAKGLRVTLADFAQLNKSGTYIVSVHKHLSVVKNGMVCDAWDCSAYKVGNYWKVS